MRQLCRTYVVNNVVTLNVLAFSSCVPMLYVVDVSSLVNHQMALCARLCRLCIVTREIGKARREREGGGDKTEERERPRNRDKAR